MNATLETASLAGSLDKQLRLLRELSTELVLCRKTYVSMDLEAMYQHIATQTLICDRLRETEEDRKTSWRAACITMGLNPDEAGISALTARLDSPEAARLRELVTELVIAEGELRSLNRAHIALIEGSRRTLNVLANVLASFAPTYSRPVAASSEIALKTGAPQ